MATAVAPRVGAKTQNSTTKVAKAIAIVMVAVIVKVIFTAIVKVTVTVTAIFSRAPELDPL